MKNLGKILISVTLSLMFCFTCFGYAALSTSMTVSGDAKAAPPNEVFITEIEMVSSNMTTQSAEKVHPTNVICNINGARRDTVTYKITVYNGTPYKYAYAGLQYSTGLDGYNGNDYIGNYLTIVTKDKQTDSSGTFNTSDSIESGETKSFYATYTISRTNIANRDLSTLVNYKFALHIDSMGAVAINSCLEKFAAILNDTSTGGGYETLTDKIDDKYDGQNDWKANYIGNVVDSTGTDSQTIRDLFEGDLTLIIDGVETNVTVLIKREDVDGNLNTGDSYTATYRGYSTSASGCEMTLYLTTHNLQYGTPTVYAAVFTCDKDADGNLGTWYMVGDVYEGTTNIVGYEGEESTGSFDTGTWRSKSKSYNVNDEYTYSLSQGNTIQTVTQATDTRANSTIATQLRYARQIINGDFGEYAGNAMVELKEAYENASKYYTVSSTGNITVNAGVHRSELIPHIKALDNTLLPFENIINS